MFVCISKDNGKRPRAHGLVWHKLSWGIACHMWAKLGIYVWNLVQGWGVCVCAGQLVVRVTLCPFWDLSIWKLAVHILSLSLHFMLFSLCIYLLFFPQRGSEWSIHGFLGSFPARSKPAQLKRQTTVAHSCFSLSMVNWIGRLVPWNTFCSNLLPDSFLFLSMRFLSRVEHRTGFEYFHPPPPTPNR